MLAVLLACNTARAGQPSGICKEYGREVVNPPRHLRGFHLKDGQQGDVHSSLHTSAPSWHGLTPVLQAVDMLWGTMEQAWAAIGLYMLASEDCSLWQALTASPKHCTRPKGPCAILQRGKLRMPSLAAKLQSLQSRVLCTHALLLHATAATIICLGHRLQGPKDSSTTYRTRAPEYCCAMISGLVGMWSRSAKGDRKLSGDVAQVVSWSYKS